ncbi:MAG: amino acid adenylation domain-containing protein [Paracoccaceae bacterium]
MIDCDVKLLDDTGAEVARGETGAIAIRSTGMFAGYDDPTMTDAAFVDGFFQTGDIGQFDEEGFLIVHGRASDIINRGGQKVSPEEIEDVFGLHESVKDVICFPIPHATLGETVAAAVCVNEGAAFEPSILLDFAKPQLARHKLPETIVMAQDIPRGAGGKPLRRKAAVYFDIQATAQISTGAPPSDRLAELWCLVLGVETVDEDVNFSMMGGDSLRGLRLLMLIEKEFDRRLPVDVLYSEGATLIGLRRCLIDAEVGSEHQVIIPKRADRTAPVSLNSAQTRMWSICRANPTSAIYNSSFGLRLTQDVDLQAVQRALDYLVDRHEALRARFFIEDGAVLQSFDPDACVQMQTVDLQTVPLDEREEALRDQARKAAAEIYDLESGPPARAHVFLMGELGVSLVFQNHHIIGDATTTSIIAKELATAIAANGAPDLPEIETSFGDVLSWQASKLSEGNVDALLKKWRKDMKGVAPSLNLPLDFARPAVQTNKGARLTLDFDAEIAAGLRQIAGTSGATVFSVAFAAFEVLMHRLSGQNDFVIGTAIDTRPSELQRALVGFFAGTLPVPVRIDQEQSFIEHAKATHKRLLRARSLKETPFDCLVREFAPKTRTGQPPLVQVMCNMTPWDARKQSEAGAEIEYFKFGHNSARFDMTVLLNEDEDGFGGYLEYASDLFSEATARRVVKRFEALLKSVIRDPQQCLQHFDILPKDEADLIADLSYGPELTYSRETSIAEEFAQIAEKFPDNISVRQGAQDLTYAELDAWSDAIASELANQGIGPDRVVATLLHRSPAFVAALLGITKTGATYLSLDPAHPNARLEDVLDDSQSNVLLTDTPKVALSTTAKVIDIASIVEKGIRFDRPQIDPQSLAYYAYTSGSTGKPKGCCASHRNIMAYVYSMPELPIGPRDRMLHFSSPSFDPTTFEVWCTLLAGAMIVQPTQRLPPITELADLILAQGINTMWLTTGLFHQMVDLRPDCFVSGCRVKVGGDVLSPDHVNALLETTKGVTVINAFGPTENTVISTMHHIDKDKVTGPISIGRPLANSSVHILDDHMRPVPIGVEGEMWSGGDCVARGYLRRPEVTAETFLPDPFSEDPDALIYRSGDRAKWDHTGTLYFLGRRDWQVKIRGFRVELQEIEAALRTLVGVQDAIVIARYEGAKVSALAAFVVPEVDANLTAESLRHQLQSDLPDYMVPAQWCILQDFPLNSSGKVDRKALMELDVAVPLQSIVAPRIPIETRLLTLWKELLGRDDFGIDDNFFDLGGHSLLAMQMSFRLEEDIGLPPSLSNIFQFQTIAQFAKGMKKAFDPTIQSQAPQTPETVLTQWKRVTKTDKVDPDKSFFQSGGTDNSAKELHRAIYDSLNIEMPEFVLLLDPTPLELVHYLVTFQANQDTAICYDRLIDPFAQKPAQGADQQNFYLLAGAGGHVTPFAPVVSRLSSRWSGYGVVDPALNDNEASIKTVDVLATRITKAVQTVDPEGPWILIGYSAGARPAYEAARLLSELGEPAICVIVDAGTGRNHRFPILNRGVSMLKLGLRKMHAIIDDAYARVRFGLADPIDMARRKYRSVHYLQKGRLMRSFATKTDNPVILIRTEPTNKARQFKDLGWSQTAELIEILDTPGNHYNCFKGENVSAFAQSLEKALEISVATSNARSQAKKQSHE